VIIATFINLSTSHADPTPAADLSSIFRTGMRLLEKVIGAHQLLMTFAIFDHQRFKWRYLKP
jgi:hypothetical protein